MRTLSIRALRTGSLATALLLALTACRGVVPTLGSDPASARATSDGLFGGISSRFINPERDKKAANARRLVVRNVFTPSRVFGDTSAWTESPNPTTRIAAWDGVVTPNGYRFTAATSNTPPSHAGATRHEFRLKKAGGDEFEWLEHSEFGAGNASVDAIAGIATAWIAGGERSDTAAARMERHALFPNSTREWERLFSIASSSATRDANGAWLQLHVVVMHTERTTRTYPALAKWLRGLVSPLRLHLRLHDSTHTWFDADLHNDSLIVRLRSRNGHLLPLEGGDARFPDTLRMETDASAKFSIFRVGFRKLDAQFAVVHQPNERGWAMTFRNEPDWQLPLLAEQMLHAPLRYPFAGAGTLFRITAVRDSVAKQTLIARRVVLPIQESTLMRFLARLANTGVNDYIGPAEAELDAWLAAAFGALHTDANTIISQTRSLPR